MLSQLLDVKQQRERNLRHNLAKLIKDIMLLQEQELQLRTRKESVYKTWKELTQKEGFFDRNELGLLRGDLLGVENEAKKLSHQLDTLVNEQHHLEKLRSEQEKIIRSNILEQEKLQLLEIIDDNLN